MNAPVNAVSSARTASAANTSHSVGGPVLATPVAFAAVRFAIGLGIVADALFRAGPGLAVPIWFALVGLGVVALVWRVRGSLRPESATWLAIAVLFAAGCAWRASELLQFFDIVAAIGALALAAITIHDERIWLFAARIRELIWNGVRIVGGGIAGFVPYLLWDLRETNAEAQWVQSARRLVRTVVVVVPLALIFGALLRAADPIFASFVSLPAINVDTIVQHTFIIGFFSWALAGVMRSTFAPVSDKLLLANVTPVQLGTLEVTAALVTLNLLFAGFVAAQLGWLFGGEPFLQARTGLTAAEYARRGFFQTVWTVVLLVPLLVALRASVSHNEHAKRRATMLSLPLIGLVGVIILSAVLRMQLYVQYFGMSVDRLNALVFLLWLGVVLGWLAYTVLTNRERAFAGGSIATGLLTLAALNVASPDKIVARMNVNRSLEAPSAQRPLDLKYLARLEGEAMPIAVPAILGTADAADQQQRCEAARIVLSRWGTGSQVRIRMDQPGAWRGWNAGERTAARVVSAHLPALVDASHRGCPRPIKPADKVIIVR